MNCPKDRIFWELAVLMGDEGGSAGRMQVRARLGSTRLHLSGPVPQVAARPGPGAQTCLAPMPACNPLWKWLSDEEDRLYRAAADEYRTAEKLAELAGLPLSGETKAVLRNMVARNILESCQGKGYRRTPLPPA